MSTYRFSRPILTAALIFALGLLSFLFPQKMSARTWSAEMQTKGDINSYKVLSRMHPDTLLLKARNAYFEPGKRDSAAIYLSLIVIRYFADGEKKRDARTCITSLNLLGHLYTYDAYDYTKAYRYLRLAQDLITKTGYREKESNVLANLAALHQICGSLGNDPVQKAQAARLLRINLASRIQQKDWEEVAISFINLCSLSLFSDTITVHREARLLRDSGIPDTESLKAYALLYDDALQAFKAHDYDLALEKFDAMMSQTENHPFTERFKMITLFNKLYTSIEAGKRDSVEQYAQLCSDFAAQRSFTDFSYKIYDLYADYKLALGDSLRYQHYKLKAYELADLMPDKSDVLQVNQMESQYMLDVLRDSLMEKQVQKYQIVSIIIIAALLLAAAIYYLYNYWRTKQRLEHLYLKNRQLAESNSLQPLMEEGQHSGEDPEPDTEESDADQELKRIFDRAVKALSETPAVFETDFTMTMLAEMIGERSRTLSRAINEVGLVSFTVLLSRFRIMESCRRMADTEKYGKFTIESIAQSVGFKSRTNFIAAFKKQTGMTPSEYLKMSRQNRSTVSFQTSECLSE